MVHSSSYSIKSQEDLYKDLYEFANKFSKKRCRYRAALASARRNHQD